MSRYWTCTKCSTRSARVKQKCPSCGKARPAPRRPKHLAALDRPYEEWVREFGEVCGICRRPPGPTRRLDRDHDHVTGEPRGLLCVRCNRALPSWVDSSWLLLAAAYLAKYAERTNAGGVV